MSVPCTRQAIGDLRAVHSFDPGEALRCETCLVGLQRPDQMPLDIPEVRKRVGFRDRFLDVVFAERALAEGIDSLIASTFCPLLTARRRIVSRFRFTARAACAIRNHTSCHAFSYGLIMK